MQKTNFYDGLFILNSDAYSRNPEEVSGAIAKTIESLGGTMRVSRLFDDRKLAYPIDGHRRGAYWMTYFRLATDQLEELNRLFQLNNNVIRFLITRVDSRLEETLVDHALNPQKAEAANAAATTEDEAEDVYEDSEDDDKNAEA